MVTWESTMELLNNPLREAHQCPMRHRHQNARECSKKSVQQGRALPGRSRRGSPLFDARSVHGVRELERREERHVCEPEGRQKGENAAGGFFQHSPRRRIGKTVAGTTASTGRLGEILPCAASRLAGDMVFNPVDFAGMCTRTSNRGCVIISPSL